MNEKKYQQNNRKIQKKKQMKMKDEKNIQNIYEMIKLILHQCQHIILTMSLWSLLSLFISHLSYISCIFPLLFIDNMKRRRLMYEKHNFDDNSINSYIKKVKILYISTITTAATSTSYEMYVFQMKNYFMKRCLEVKDFSSRQMASKMKNKVFFTASLTFYFLLSFASYFFFIQHPHQW